MAFSFLTYVSRSLIGAHGCEIRELARQCARNNRVLGVTGALYFDDRQFLQAIEGVAGAVDALFARIAADPRHQDVRVLSQATIPARRFGAWEMKMVDGTRFAHLRGHFAYDRLESAGAEALDRRLRLLERL